MDGGAQVITGTRHRLANRRAIETHEIEHDGHDFRIGLGRDVLAAAGDVRVWEVFVNGQKVNSPIDVLASDGAVLMSLLLQHGCAIGDIRHSMKQNPDGTPSSVLGRIAALIDRAGREDGDSAAAAPRSPRPPDHGPGQASFENALAEGQELK